MSYLETAISVISQLIRIKWISIICVIMIVSPLSQTLYSYSNVFEINGDDKLKINVKPLNDIQITSITGEKPQSKLWFHDNSWWAVLPNLHGTKLWQLEDDKWINVLHLSDSINTNADIKNIDDVTHILLFQGVNSELISIEYNPIFKKYELWPIRKSTVRIPLEVASETATIDVDTSDRMWLVSDDETEIHVRWSDFPYSSWSTPFTLETGISEDDICTICSFPDGSIGVMWSNQRTKRFGFRIHQYGSEPDKWMKDEIPASRSAIDLNGGMADDHLNLAVTSDGTLYAAIKTSYDSVGFPLIGLLVRKSSGIWDTLNIVDDEGSRGIVIVNEKRNMITVIYSSYRDNKIVCKTSNTNSILFGNRQTLIEGRKKINNATSAKQNVTNEIVILASEYGFARGVQINWPSKE